MPFIRFQPIYQERVWGGRQLEALYRRSLPNSVLIGESWELVDRAEVQSKVISADFSGQTLHDLWMQQREKIFGTASPNGDRFPLLIKILDAQAKLSVQVHPTSQAAQKLGSESKTEAWYFAETKSQAEIFLGLRTSLDQNEILERVKNQTLVESLNCYYPHSGDVTFIPSGCVHAIGEGNLIVEVQQNSDTTYRLYDWDRVDALGKPRQLHLNEALQSIGHDLKPLPPRPLKNAPLTCEFFSLQQLNLTQSMAWESYGTSFTFLFVKEGAMEWEGDILKKGEFGLIPASVKTIELSALIPDTVVLQIQWGH